MDKITIMIIRKMEFYQDHIKDIFGGKLDDTNGHKKYRDIEAVYKSNIRLSHTLYTVYRQEKPTNDDTDKYISQDSY